MSSSPAERYAQARTDRRYPHLARFRDLYSFGLDEFQVEACQSVEDGHGVLVAAPTGSGKTIVGEFAVQIALETGRKCFYTTPIKALSNQKYQDLKRRHGADRVGLLTGDNTINGEAPIVVMTTEVLRNMIYAGSRTLEDLGYVVMDEVHYLADRFRGAVWEEVIISLAPSVSIVSLSATVSNVEEFGAWLTEVRGDTVTIVEERRPVPLYQHVMVGRRMYPLFEQDGRKVNHALERMAREDFAAGRGRRPHQGKGQRRPRTRYRTPDRVDVVEKLDSEGLLPAICFIFSRAGCAAAVEQCLHARLTLTTEAERDRIHQAVDAAAVWLPEDDLHVLGFHDFREALGRGVAAHHAGMLPAFKEVVEQLFSEGLLKIVFATETLALGINMPARSVVIERLSKWNGETHVDLTPGEYTQLTGRAGRRGIDIEGHGVVLWQPGFDPRHVAGLASTRTYPLISSFQPSYNMAVNLVHQLGRERARKLLEQSFAQFQADRAVVHVARQVHKADDALQGYQAAATCDRGDFMEYMRLRRELKDAENRGSKARRAAQREEVAGSLRALKPGDIIDVPSGRWAGVALVLQSDGQTDAPRPLVLTANRHARRLALVDFSAPVEPRDRMRIPKGFNSRNPQARRDLASALRTRAEASEHLRNTPPRRASAPEDPRIDELRKALRAHPCHQCPERESHARWAERYLRLERENSQQRRRVEQRTNSVARKFDRVCELLDELGYLDGDEVTEAGRRLQRIYGDLDLVLAESLQRGVLDGLDSTELAAIASGLSYEARVDDAPAPVLPTKSMRAAADELTTVAEELMATERSHRLSFSRPPDLGFAHAVWQWCRGASLDTVLDTAQLAAGDFVRAMKQLQDVLGQLADAAGPGSLRTTARAALDDVGHGVVAYSSVSDDGS